MNEDRREDKQTEWLEIYKLHAELADRVSQRREGTNRLYVSLLTGVFILLAAFLRYGTGAVPLWVILLGAGIIGVSLSASWYVVIRSYRQLNTGKFKALDEVENELVYPFFRREWEFLEQGKKIGQYWKLTVVETFLPLFFGIFSLFLIFISLFYLSE